jgi:hypothetical protein
LRRKQLEWFDHRKANLQRFKFFELTTAERLTFLKEVRGGGSVPPSYEPLLKRHGVRMHVGKVFAVDRLLDGRLNVKMRTVDKRCVKRARRC